MAGHTDKYAKFAFCKYLESKGYTDIKIINTPVDISAKFGDNTWWFELKKTAKKDKYFGATTLIELEQAQIDSLHFRFVIAQADTEDEACMLFKFYLLSLGEMTEIGNMSIPPFKVYFNLRFDNNELLEAHCTSFSCDFNQIEYEKSKTLGKREENSITFMEAHIDKLKKYRTELQKNE